MANLLIRNLDDEVKERLRLRAAESGRTVGEEAREILVRSLQSRSLPTRNTEPPKTGLDLIRPLREAVEKYGGVELEIPSRKSAHAPNVFEDAAPFEPESAPKPRRKRRK